MAFFGDVSDNKNLLGKGIGREAVALLIQYGFCQLNTWKICCYVISDHPAVKTYRELGGKEEGLLKKHFFSENKYKDVLILSWFR
jgi:RimJ/RimL family protein N-acetyltransferase